jgi:hypothetical protein
MSESKTKGQAETSRPGAKRAPIKARKGGTRTLRAPDTSKAAAEASAPTKGDRKS